METTPSPTFRDAKDRTWNLSLSIGLAKKIRDEVGVDFGNISDGSVFAELATDPYKFAATLWLMVESQAKAKPGREEVTPEDFAEALTGDVLDSASEALVAAIINFTRGPMRPAVKSILEATRADQSARMEAVEKWATENRETIREQAMREIESQLSTSGSASPS